MNLRELMVAVNNAVEYANECEESLDSIIVSLQIDGPECQSLVSIDEVNLYYDNNLQASGCVLRGFI